MEPGGGGMKMDFRAFAKKNLDERSYRIFIEPLTIMETSNILLMKCADNFAKEVLVRNFGNLIKEYVKETKKSVRIVAESKEEDRKRGIKISYDQYRNEIRKFWLPFMGRKKLKSFEYVKIKEFYDNKIPLKEVLNGLKKCLKEGKRRGKTIYSIGYCLPYIKQGRRK